MLHKPIKIIGKNRMNYAKLHGKYLKSMTIFGNLGLAAIRVRSNSAAIGYLRLTRNTLGYFRRNNTKRSRTCPNIAAQSEHARLFPSKWRIPCEVGHARVVTIVQRCLLVSFRNERSFGRVRQSNVLDNERAVYKRKQMVLQPD